MYLDVRFLYSVHCNVSQIKQIYALMSCSYMPRTSKCSPTFTYSQTLNFWLRYYATIQKVAGSIPDKVTDFFFLSIYLSLAAAEWPCGWLSL
jgi:hypothetical protein